MIVIAMATADGTLAATGRLVRWLPETGPRRVLATTRSLSCA